MLNMEVDDYLITSDKYNVTVEKKTRDENGELKTTTQDDATVFITKLVGYYPTLSRALKGIRNNYILGEGTNIHTIDDYRKEIEIITNKFNEQLNLLEDWEEREWK